MVVAFGRALLYDIHAGGRASGRMRVRMHCYDVGKGM
jgi:hypothetical protein